MHEPARSPALSHVWLQPLVERVDLITLVSLGFVSTAGRRAAAAELRERLKRGVFVAVPLVDGVEGTHVVHECSYRADDSETESVTPDEDSWALVGRGEHVCSVTRYDRCAPIALTWQDGLLRVSAGADGTFQWRGEALSVGGASPWGDVDPADQVYRGQKVRVYWTPTPEDGVDVVQWYGRSLPPGRAGMMFAQIRLDEDYDYDPPCDLAYHQGFLSRGRGPNEGPGPRYAHGLRYAITEAPLLRPRVQARVVSFEAKAQHLVGVAAIQVLSDFHFRSRVPRRGSGPAATPAFVDYMKSLVRWAGLRSIYA